MTEFEDNSDLVVPDELTTIKARADLLGVTYHPSIGLEKLRAKVKEAMGDEPKKPEAKVVKEEPVVESDSARRYRKRKEANELVRIRVSCMNPAKKEWDGEIITAGNSLVGSMTKYVPFNVEDGWHVPRMIYSQLVQRECQIFVTVRDARGNASRKGKLIKEFAIEVLPQLTADELGELARRQAMSKSID